MQGQQTDAARQSLSVQITKAEAKIDQLVEHVMNAGNPRIAAAYETRITKLEKEKLLLAERMANLSTPRHTFEEMFELSLDFLSSPWKLWETGRIEARRLVLKLTFAQHLLYAKENGFRTPQATVPFRFLNDFCQKSEMVLLERIELSTSPLPRYHSCLNFPLFISFLGPFWVSVCTGSARNFSRISCMSASTWA